MVKKKVIKKAEADDAPLPLEIIVRKNQLTKYTGLKYTTISKMMRYNQFPLGMFLNDAQNTRGWTLSELQEWQRKYFSEMRRRTIAAAAAREARITAEVEGP